MKTLIGFIGAAFIGGVVYLFSYDPPNLYFNRSGLIKKQMKIWNDTVAVSSATPVIDISSAGFTVITDIQAQVIQTSGTISQFAWCNTKTYTTSAVTLTMAQGNSTTVNILSSLVLLGPAIQAPSSFSGMFVDLRVTGY